MPDSFLVHEYDNGLVLLAEPMDWLESAALTMLLPAGCARDPVDFAGLGNFTCEMVQRGAGDRNSRQLVEELERLGVDRGSAVSSAHASYAAAMPAERLDEAVEIHADMLLRPTLPVDQMSEALQVCFQELRSIEDDPVQQLMKELRRRHFSDPWGRCPQGSESSLGRITIEHVREHFDTTYRPNGSILSFAGKLDWPRLKKHVGELFGEWAPGSQPQLEEAAGQGRYHHIHQDSSQTHIGLAYESVPYRSADYYQARGAVGVLSDGMSSRLFTEVRERRGLCYAVSAGMHSLRDLGCVLCYSGTSTDRAQETLDVLLAELARLTAGIQQHELDRLKARIKSALIMQQESSRSRTSSIAADWYYLGRVQSLSEISSKIDQLTCDSINAFLAEHPPGDFTVVTLGEKPLEVRVGVS